MLTLNHWRSIGPSIFSARRDGVSIRLPGRYRGCSGRTPHGGSARARRSAHRSRRRAVAASARRQHSPIAANRRAVGVRLEPRRRKSPVQSCPADGVYRVYLATSAVHEIGSRLCGSANATERSTTSYRRRRSPRLTHVRHCSSPGSNARGFISCLSNAELSGDSGPWKSRLGIHRREYVPVGSR